MKFVVWVKSEDGVWLDTRDGLLELGFAVGGAYWESREGAEELAQVFRREGTRLRVVFPIRVLPEGATP